MENIIGLITELKNKDYLEKIEGKLKQIYIHIGKILFSQNRIYDFNTHVKTIKDLFRSVYKDIDKQGFSESKILRKIDIEYFRSETRRILSRYTLVSNINFSDIDYYFDKIFLELFKKKPNLERIFDEMYEEISK
jgi:hypothetical protein